jgi:hypothetical protein
VESQVANDVLREPHSPPLTPEQIDAGTNQLQVEIDAAAPPVHVAAAVDDDAPPPLPANLLRDVSAGLDARAKQVEGQLEQSLKAHNVDADEQLTQELANIYAAADQLKDASTEDDRREALRNAMATLSRKIDEVPAPPARTAAQASRSETFGRTTQKTVPIKRGLEVVAELIDSWIEYLENLYNNILELAGPPLRPAMASNDGFATLYTQIVRLRALREDMPNRDDRDAVMEAAQSAFSDNLALRPHVYYTRLRVLRERIAQLPLEAARIQYDTIVAERLVSSPEIMERSDEYELLSDAETTMQRVPVNALIGALDVIERSVHALAVPVAPTPYEPALSLPPLSTDDDSPEVNEAIKLIHEELWLRLGQAEVWLDISDNNDPLKIRIVDYRNDITHAIDELSKRIVEVKIKQPPPLPDLIDYVDRTRYLLREQYDKDRDELAVDIAKIRKPKVDAQPPVPPPTAPLASADELFNGASALPTVVPDVPINPPSSTTATGSSSSPPLVDFGSPSKTSAEEVVAAFEPATAAKPTAAKSSPAVIALAGPTEADFKRDVDVARETLRKVSADLDKSSTKGLHKLVQVYRATIDPVLGDLFAKWKKSAVPLRTKDKARNIYTLLVDRARIDHYMVQAERFHADLNAAFERAAQSSTRTVMEVERIHEYVIRGVNLIGVLRARIKEALARAVAVRARVEEANVPHPNPNALDNVAFESITDNWKAAAENAAIVPDMTLTSELIAKWSVGKHYDDVITGKFKNFTGDKQEGLLSDLQEFFGEQPSSVATPSPAAASSPGPRSPASPSSPTAAAAKTAPAVENRARRDVKPPDRFRPGSEKKKDSEIGEVSPMIGDDVSLIGSELSSDESDGGGAEWSDLGASEKQALYQRYEALKRSGDEDALASFLDPLRQSVKNGIWDIFDSKPRDWPSAATKKPTTVARREPVDEVYQRAAQAKSWAGLSDWQKNKLYKEYAAAAGIGVDAVAAFVRKLETDNYELEVQDKLYRVWLSKHEGKKDRPPPTRTRSPSPPPPPSAGDVDVNQFYSTLPPPRREGIGASTQSPIDGGGELSDESDSESEEDDATAEA